MSNATLREWGTACLMVTVLAAATVEAQPLDPRGPDRFRGFGPSDALTWLVAMPEVQQELDVTREQRELLDALQEDLRRQWRSQFRRGNRGRRGRLADRRERIQALNRQIERLVTVVLEREQTQRLDELRLQWEGVDALDRPEFADKLGLTDDQRETISELRDAERKSGTEPDDERRSPTEATRRANELRAKVWAVLTSEQGQEWLRLMGKTFHFPERIPFDRSDDSSRRRGRDR